MYKAIKAYLIGGCKYFRFTGGLRFTSALGPLSFAEGANIARYLSLARDRLAFLDRKAATMSDTEWMILIAQLRASPEVAMEVLGMDSTHLSFDEEIEERIRRRKSALSDIHYRAQQDKIMSQGDSTEYMRRYIKNMSANYYGSGKTMEWPKKFIGQELIDEYTRMSVALGDPSKPKLYHLHAGSKRMGSQLGGGNLFCSQDRTSSFHSLSALDWGDMMTYSLDYPYASTWTSPFSKFVGLTSPICSQDSARRSP
ncbi:hypothetical protein Tco_0373582 [Tanacetum coccineum]